MTRHTRPAAVILALMLATLAARPATAHDLSFTDALVLLKTDGTYQVDLTCDLDALALGAPPKTDPVELMAALQAMSPEELEQRVEDLRHYFERRVRLRFDGEDASPRITFPYRGTELALQAQPPTLLGLTARLSGRVPEGAGEVSLQVSRSFPPLQLKVLDERHTPPVLVEPGSLSPPYRLDQPATTTAAPADLAGRYLVLGYWHILPAGLDHIFFVLGLFLLSTRLKPLLWQVSAFTLAHTLTLALASYGVVKLSPSVVEPLIALSIAYVGIENLVTRELKPWRLPVVFGFGLLHGLGFAGVLGELGLPAEGRVTALLSFNVGVELGQLTVILAAFLLLGPFRQHPHYRRITLALSTAIALAGLYWAVTRL